MIGWLDFLCGVWVGVALTVVYFLTTEWEEER